MLLRVIFFTFLIFNSLWGYSQIFKKNKKDNNLSNNYLRSNELNFGIKANSNGWGFIIEKVKIPSEIYNKVWQISFNEIKHPKEYRTNVNNSRYFGNSNASFIYGKVNNFYHINLLRGWRRHLARKADKSGVALMLSYMMGPSLGIAKPYYLDLQYDREDIRTEKYNDQNASVFLNTSKVFGYSGFSHGLLEPKLYPGFSSKLGLYFDWGKTDEIVKGLDIGLGLDAFYKPIPIMVIAKNAAFHPYLYIIAQIGNRW